MVSMNSTAPNVQQIFAAISDDMSIKIFEIIQSNAKKAKHLQQEFSLNTKCECEFNLCEQ
jgi:hypothetical protein